MATPSSTRRSFATCYMRHIDLSMMKKKRKKEKIFAQLCYEIVLQQLDLFSTVQAILTKFLQISLFMSPQSINLLPQIPHFFSSICIDLLSSRVSDKFSLIAMQISFLKLILYQISTSCSP